MPKDYAKRNTRHNAKRKNNSYKRGGKQSKSNGGLWLLTGLLAGLLIAGLAYLKQQPKTGTDNQAVAAANAILDKHAGQEIKDKAKIKLADKTTGPQFDFYTILPKMKVWVPPNNNDNGTTPPPNPNVPPPFNAANVPAPTAPPPNASTPNVATASDKSAPSAPQSTTTTKQTTTATNQAPKNTAPAANQQAHYLLQVASLEDYQKADQLKAQLTLAGFNVSIETINLPNKTLNKVVVGPFADLQSAKAAEQSLAQQNVQGTLITMTNS